MRHFAWILMEVVLLASASCSSHKTAASAAARQARTMEPPQRDRQFTETRDP